MKTVSFVKMSGAGNDFVMIDNRRHLLKKNLPALARKLCDRKESVGADGLILLEGSKKEDIRMRILNPDGSEAEMCGNGIRCIAKFAVDQKIAPKKLSIETLAGPIQAVVRGQIVKARMVPPQGLKLRFPLKVAGKKISLNFVNTGVPHAILAVKTLDRCDVAGLGRLIRRHSYFAPKGANVNFIALKARNRIQIRTYERGVEDETLSCGTGSTAGALVAASLKKWKSPIYVETQSGEILKIYFSQTNGAFSDVFLEGVVKKSFEGRVLA